MSATTQAPPSARLTPATEREALERVFETLNAPTRPKVALNALARMVGRVLGRDDAAPVASSAVTVDVLTAREREVVTLLAGGAKLQAVADLLGISGKTADAHKTNLMRKLGVHNQAQLTLWAVRNGLVKA